MPIHGTQDSDITRAINHCLTCAKACLETFNYCLEEKGTAFSGKLISTLKYCEDACNLSAHLLSAESSFYNQACELTYELTTACAIECERYEYDEVFQKCAEICRHCADACRGMSGMTVKVTRAEL